MPSNTPPSADNQQERLHPQWIVGFVDGEGCFSISCNRNATTALGYQVFPEFVITQGAKSLESLERIKLFFGCGRIFVNRRNDNHREHIYRYCVRSLKDLTETIIPFFQKHSLQTKKNVDFKIFCRVVQMMNKKQHLTNTGLDTIIQLKSTMNRKVLIKRVVESSETIRQNP